jgi:hypothetical protein
MSKKLQEKTLDELGMKSGRMRDLRVMTGTGSTHAKVFEALGGQRLEMDGPGKESRLEKVFEGMGEGRFLDAFSRADWIVLSGKDGLENLVDWGLALLEKVLPNAFPRETRHLLVDLCGIKKLQGGALARAMEVARRLQSHGEVAVGFSETTLDTAVEIMGGAASSHLVHNLRNVREHLGTGSCGVFSVDGTCGFATGKDTLTQDFKNEGTVKNPGKMADIFFTAHSVAGLLGIQHECRLPIAVAATECQLSTKSNPSWVEIDSCIRQKLQENG